MRLHGGHFFFSSIILQSLVISHCSVSASKGIIRIADISPELVLLHEYTKDINDHGVVVTFGSKTVNTDTHH